MSENYGLKFRLVNESDADFILGLRTDDQLSRFLSTTSPSLHDQLLWIKSYKNRELAGQEYYFIALDEDDNRFGTTRIYNLEEDCFEIGSWLFSKNSPSGAAIKMDIIAREFGFNRLNFNFCKFSVRKENSTVVKYHFGYKPKLVREDEDNFYFKLNKTDFFTHSQKLIKLLI